ncbi:MAG: DUF305 domain-containing protein [bacterium]|nr:DUF305 domain-containing protein [bacterium]
MARILLFIVTLLSVVTLTGCSSLVGFTEVFEFVELGKLFGDDHGDAGPEAGGEEQAFLQAMVPHHQMAIEMAQLAQQRATLPELLEMSSEIISTQGAEITQMEQIHQRLFGTTLVPDEMAHVDLGLTAEEAGMHMDMESLMEAESFDREFINMMIMHHQGAVRMAQVIQEHGEDFELNGLAQQIIAAQTAEISTLEALRLEHFGEGTAH